MVGKKEPISVTKEGEGKRFSVGKPMVRLVPPIGEELEAKTWEKGAYKYDLHNWKKGMAYSAVMNSLKRHVNAMLRGEWIDEDTGETHIGAIRCNTTMLAYFRLEKGYDSRFNDIFDDAQKYYIPLPGEDMSKFAGMDKYSDEFHFRQEDLDEIEKAAMEKEGGRP